MMEEQLWLESSEQIRIRRKRLERNENSIAELKRLFIRIYEDNACGRLSDERFDMLSLTYETEQKQLETECVTLRQEIEVQERQNENVEKFIQTAHKYSRFSLLKSRSRKTLGDLRITNESYSNLLQHTHNLLKGTIDMEVFLIMPTTPEGKAKLSKELAKFHAEQALKMVQKLPCPTEQKLELIDAVVEHLRSKQ